MQPINGCAHLWLLAFPLPPPPNHAQNGVTFLLLPICSSWYFPTVANPATWYSWCCQNTLLYAIENLIFFKTMSATWCKPDLLQTKCAPGCKPDLLQTMSATGWRPNLPSTMSTTGCWPNFLKTMPATGNPFFASIFLLQDMSSIFLPLQPSSASHSRLPHF